MKRAVIYKITSPTGRIYIGKTVDFVNRMTSYRNLNNHQQPLIHSSIAKYGWENHQVEVLEESTPEELINLEITYIKQYNSYFNKILKGGSSKCANYLWTYKNKTI